MPFAETLKVYGWLDFVCQEWETTELGLLSNVHKEKSGSFRSQIV